MPNNNPYLNKPLKEQINKLCRILYESEPISEALRLIPSLELPNWYLGSGCITQTVWNFLSDKELRCGIKDFDLVYFDDKDVSYEGEDKYIQKAKEVFKNFPHEVEIKNQARVHMWYEKKFGKKIEPFSSCIVADDAGGAQPFPVSYSYGVKLQVAKNDLEKAKKNPATNFLNPLKLFLPLKSFLSLFEEFDKSFFVHLGLFQNIIKCAWSNWLIMNGYGNLASLRMHQSNMRAYLPAYLKTLF